jgi:archaemetzincin
MDPSLVRTVAACLERNFAVRVMVLTARPLPGSAYYAPRRRYRGDRLVGWLDTHRPPGASKILGLMSSDLSATKGPVYDWGVMGVASLAGHACVVSDYRLGGHRASASLIERRMRQVALHELGHNFGLPHCRTPRCIMNDAEGGIEAVDASSGEFCPRCRDQLRGLLRD